MTILNFKEIPAPTQTKNRKSDDLDAFEKFAEEFFVEIKGAKLLDRCARGADSGIDLKIEYNGEVCLVSCKHKAHSGQSVNEADETSSGFIDLLEQHNCKKFIAFYSTIASVGLRDKITGALSGEIAKKGNLNYEFFYNSDIEAAILAINNPRGWLFAMRYFPKSYINLFQRFFTPIEYYNEQSKELKKLSNGFYELSGPFGVASSNEPLEKIIQNANDRLTSELHKYFFYLAIQDTINLFPHYFVYKKGADLVKLSMDDISPAWEVLLDKKYANNTITCNIPIIICGLWSMWDSEKATKKMIHYRNNEKLLCSIIKNERRYILEEEIPLCYLNFGHITKFLDSELRNLFARLVAFCPAGGAKTELNLEKDNVINFDPDKTGKSNVEWQLDLSNLDGYKWLQDRLQDRLK